MLKRKAAIGSVGNAASIELPVMPGSFVAASFIARCAARAITFLRVHYTLWLIPITTRNDLPATALASMVGSCAILFRAQWGRPPFTSALAFLCALRQPPRLGRNASNYLAIISVTFRRPACTVLVLLVRRKSRISYPRCRRGARPNNSAVGTRNETVRERT